MIDERAKVILGILFVLLLLLVILIGLPLIICTMSNCGPDMFVIF